jgi:hypothetical protein
VGIHRHAGIPKLFSVLPSVIVLLFYLISTRMVNGMNWTF